MAAPDDGKRVVPRTPIWRDSLARRMVAALALPVFWLLNRPALQWFANAAYDFALRCNGIAINFKGRHGLTRGEECFFAAIDRRLPPGFCSMSAPTTACSRCCTV